MKRLSPALMIPLLISCEMIVDVDVPFEGKQVTVNSFFTPDSLWSVQLNLNRNILDEEPFQEINDAQVVIYEAGSPIDTLTNIGYGRFRSANERSEPGKTYSLSVTVAGQRDLYSISSIPFPSPITGVDVYESTASNDTMLKVKLRDDGAETNYYELYMDLETEYYNYDKRQVEYHRHRIQLISKDPAIPNDNDRFSNSVIFKDVRFNGRETELTFQTSGSGMSHHGVITVTLKTLSEDGYNYLRTAVLQKSTSGDPFAQPVNVYNNIQNGFGIFAGYSASIHMRSKPKPVIHSIDSMTGRAGDRIVITGENFIASPDSRANVAFPGVHYPISGQILELTPTRIEVIVPDMAVTGRIVVLNGRMAVSDSDFIVTN
jgi:hypothetical protein